jgi:hypothetical protein
MVVSSWITVGAFAWFCASLVVGVLASRVGALATPDGTLFIKYLADAAGLTGGAESSR